MITTVILSEKKMSNWHGGKGSKQRPYDKEKFNDSWDRIFKTEKDQRHKQQDMTELNADGNRTRGRYGEDLEKR